MRRLLIGMALLAIATSSAIAAKTEYRRITVDDYTDHMKAAWLGQMVGVSWGAPTEFRYVEKMIPENEVPKWHDGMANEAFGQDDLYVEMTFVRTLEQYGIGVSPRQAGLDFGASQYALWCANASGRGNLRNGIAPPDSGHPKFNPNSDAIDYQIEADFSGILAPGQPNVAIALGEKFGRIMNYGDGLYAGQFMGGMYAEAFFERDIEKIVRAGLRCIPAQCQYAECVRDLLDWHRQYPNDWAKTWQLVEDKYFTNPEYRKCAPSGSQGIDAKLNGAYVVMGLLYGEGDPDKTYAYSVRCGQDSDCNPASAMGVLFASIGWKSLPERFKTGLDEKQLWSYTSYNFPKLLTACGKIARQFVSKSGGKIEKKGGVETFVIPVRAPKPSKYEPSWQPGPIANSKYTAKEISMMTEGISTRVQADLDKFAPGWKISHCTEDMPVGLMAEFGGRKNVLATHPPKDGDGCILSRKIKVTDATSVLKLAIGHHPGGDWDLVVRANGDEQQRERARWMGQRYR
jgi:hypothetical protein